ARSPEDAALLAESLFGYSADDRATQPIPAPRLLETALSAPPVTPTLAFVRPPGWESADEQMRLGLQELVDALGEQCFEAVLPNAFDEAATIRERINFAEMAKCYFAFERRGRDQLSAATCAALDTGKAVLARDYIAALDWPDILYAGLAEIFERCDAIVTLAAPGPAPAGLASTGSAIFNGLWTLCGTPAVTVPLLEADSGLPMGIQLVGRRGDDARLLRTARWLAGHASSIATQEP
ncbi:MAG: amidase, partial [Rhodospirillaceae bacterium]|nr:amidase [Rhodospirillaceae bacterium]